MTWVLRRSLAYSVVLMLVATAVPVVAVSSPGSIEVPLAEDWGVPTALQDIQAKEMAALDRPDVAGAATYALEDVVASTGVRDPAAGPYRLVGSNPPAPSIPDVIELAQHDPNGSLPDFLQILLDQPLKISVVIKSGDHVNWVEASLRPTIVPLNLMGWVAVDVDNDTSTGNGAGEDLQVRLIPVMEQRNRDIGLIPPRVHIQYRGGLAVEIERLGTGGEDIPIDVTFFKFFRYSGISYTWFLDYEVDHIPEFAYMSITADQANVTAEVTGDRLMDLINRIISGNLTGLLNDTRLTDISGPYTIYHTTQEDMAYVHASLGYLKLASRAGSGETELEETSWVTARVKPPADSSVAPREFSLWLDSPAFNRTFDHLNWTSDRPSRLELEYFDARENNTQAMALIDVAPTNLRVEIGEAMEDVGRVAKIHFTSTEPVSLIRFDEWDFVGNDRRRYLHTHVELVDLPSNVWLNGTLDVGGQPYDVLLPDPQAGAMMGQLMDTLMVGFASKLFNIGNTLRALPQTVLDMPDQEGYTNVEFVDPTAYLGKLEMWLTSRNHITVDGAVDYFAFFNDSVEPVGGMVQVGFSARLLDIRSFHANFADKKQIVLDSRYNREFRALFVDDKNDATASIWFSNIPHNVSLELLEDQLIYMGDSTVDRIQYTSQIGSQYIRMRLDGVPGGINILMGDVVSGVDVLLGEIDAIDLRITDGAVREMEEDHLLLEMDEAGRTAASVHVTGVSGLLVDRSVENTVSLRTGGHPMKVLVRDEPERFELKAKLDPLPSRMDTEVSDVLGLSNITFPSLGDVTSVLEFASIMYSISDLADSVLVALGDATIGLVDGLGTHSSNVSFGFDGDRNMDLTATIIREGSIPVKPAPWVHGAAVNMLPEGNKVLLDAKVHLTGISPKGSIELVSSAERTNLVLDLKGFAPKWDHLAIIVNGASLIEGGGGKDVWLFVTETVGNFDLYLSMDIEADVSLGGEVRARLDLRSSQALGQLHARTRIRGDNVATVEAFMSNVPAETKLDLVYTNEISLKTELSQSLTSVFVKMSRNVADERAPATTLILHDVPTLVDLMVESGGGFDMDDPSPMASLPNLKVTTNEPGLDLLIDIEGRSLGNKVDVHMDAREIKDVSMALSGKEYRVSAGRLDFVNFGVRGMPFSETVRFDRIDVVATHLSSVTLIMHMVFGVYPLFDIKDLVASGLQLSLSGHVVIRDEPHDLSVSIFEVPLSIRSMPHSHDNGVALREAKGGHRLFVPAPISTLMGTLLG